VTVSIRLELGLPALRSAVADTRDPCRVDRPRLTASGRVRCTVRTTPALWDALADDPTVLDRLSSSDGATSLRQVDLDPGDLTYHAWVDRGGVLTGAEVTVDGWRLDLRFPDQDRCSSYHRACVQRGLSVHVLRLSTDVGRAASQEQSASHLTHAQWEVLNAANREGYFDVPRRTSLTELAASLDLSRQAVSERLRRGLGTVLDSRLPPAPHQRPGAEIHPPAERE
jgi:predicted DNA binding protein